MDTTRDSNMANFHCSVSYFSRKKGDNIVAAAAYRAGHKLKSLDDNLIKYPNRPSNDILFSAMLINQQFICSHKKVKEVITLRQEIWNKVELSEKRRDSRLGREVMVALPVELNLEQMIKLVKVFSGYLASRYYTVFDINLHKPKTDLRNFHCHILFPAREYLNNTFGKKIYKLDHRPSGRKEFLLIRKKWESITNFTLDISGSDQRISCKPNNSIVKRYNYPMNIWKAYKANKIQLPWEDHVKEVRGIENRIIDCKAKKILVQCQLFALWYAEYSFLKKNKYMDENEESVLKNKYYDEGERIFRSYGNSNTGNIIKQIGRISKLCNAIRKTTQSYTAGIQNFAVRSTKYIRELCEPKEYCSNRALYQNNCSKEEEKRIEVFQGAYPNCNPILRKRRVSRQEQTFWGWNKNETLNKNTISDAHRQEIIEKARAKIKRLGKKSMPSSNKRKRKNYGRS